MKKRGPSSGYVNNLVDTIESLRARLGDNPSGGEGLDNSISSPSLEAHLSPSSSSGGPSSAGLGVGVGPNFSSTLRPNLSTNGGALLSSSAIANANADWSTALVSSENNPKNNYPAAVWTHETFRSATLSTQSGTFPWWEVYYKFVHPKWSFIFKTWFLNHFQDLPLILLHGMYGASTFYASDPLEEGELHFSTCKAVIDEAIENPDPLKTAAIMLMAVYSINSKRIKSAVSYLCLSIRFCQILGIDKDKYEVWKCNSGRMIGFENESPKEFCRSVWCSLYAHDFYAIFLIGVPGSVTLDIDTSYLVEYRSGTFDNGWDDPKRFIWF